MKTWMDKLSEHNRKVLKGLGVFLTFMLVCTLVSKGIYANGLPQVTVKQPVPMAVTHEVEVNGNVKQSRELAVNVPDGLRVSEVFVIPGDTVEPGEPLFLLDTAYLQDRIGEKELEFNKLRLQVATLQNNLALEGEEKNQAMIRAAQDKLKAAEAAEKELKRAAEDEAKDREELAEHERNIVGTTSEEERKKQEEAYQSWKSQMESGAAEQVNAADQVEVLIERIEQLRKEADDLKKQIADTSGNIPSGGTSDSASETASESENTAGTGGASRTDTEELKVRLEQKEAELAGAQAALSRLQQTQKELAASAGSLAENAVAIPSFAEDDAARKAWGETEKNLLDRLGEAIRRVEDAQDNKEDKLTEAERRLEDSMSSEKSDSTLGITRMELDKSAEDLESLRTILKEEGLVLSKKPGTITRVSVSAGENTTSGAAVVFADMEEPLQFGVILDKEAKQYVDQGAQAQIRLGNGSGQGIEVTVDYLTELESSPGSFSAFMILPEGVGTIGQSGVFRLETQSEKFNCCIPIDALHTDENQRNFVYVLRERKGILGKELTAEKVMVEVEDKNDRYAAIGPGAIDSESQVICDSTKEFSDGDAVRLKD